MRLPIHQSTCRSTMTCHVDQSMRPANKGVRADRSTNPATFTKNGRERRAGGYIGVAKVGGSGGSVDHTPIFLIQFNALSVIHVADSSFSRGSRWITLDRGNSEPAASPFMRDPGGSPRQSLNHPPNQIGGMVEDRMHDFRDDVSIKNGVHGLSRPMTPERGVRRVSGPNRKAARRALVMRFGCSNNGQAS